MATNGSRFDGKVALITGGAKGFGEAMARRFASEGAKVLIADLDPSEGEATAASLGEAARFVRVDVANGEQVAAAVQAAVDTFGGLDILCNNAGYSHLSTPMWELPDEEFDRQFDVNVKGVFLGCKHAIPAMRARGGGVIVNTASIGAKRPRSGVTVYNASKGAVTLTRGLANEVARYNIRVNAVCPVAANTAFMETVRGPGNRLDERAQTALTKGIPLGRLCTPEDVAASAAFLASEDASFLTGVCLDVDGGRSID